mmetsp:Transcript_34/g.123  ORF Transcript_34/g.123 Transcript_34/m.123 type:complete len:248 (+) Transcript_34:1028-1771(+)
MLLGICATPPIDVRPVPGLLVLSQLLGRRTTQSCISTFANKATDFLERVEALLELHRGIVHHLIQELEELLWAVPGEGLEGGLVALEWQHPVEQLHDWNPQLVFQLHSDIVIGLLRLLHSCEDTDATRYDVGREHRGGFEEMEVCRLLRKTHEDRSRFAAQVGIPHVVPGSKHEGDHKQKELSIQVQEELRRLPGRAYVDVVLQNLDYVLQQTRGKHGPLRGNVSGKHCLLHFALRDHRRLLRPRCC